MDIADSHKENKKASYWDDLTGGTTSQYKEKVMEALIREHYSISGGKLLDVGCGTCETILKYSGIFGARSLTCLDYGRKVLEKMKLKLPGGGIIGKVADVFEIGGWAERFDLVFSWICFMKFILFTAGGAGTFKAPWITPREKSMSLPR